ncbi:hypothetical protein ElyMa_004063200 [Elysia marginata]|uniref:Uncharacterized protein n=1 Tax=Elysia marginata TaxID=1093978 RepID=A0AAV4G7K6_9GAST|nr:hypothetical protein ElyMa_004063200 [Elysia marginata]
MTGDESGFSRTLKPVIYERKSFGFVFLLSLGKHRPASTETKLNSKWGFCGFGCLLSPKREEILVKTGIILLLSHRKWSSQARGLPEIAGTSWAAGRYDVTQVVKGA